MGLICGAFYSGYIGNSNHSKSPTDIDTNPMTDDLDSQFTDSWGVALMQGKRPYMEDTYSTYFSSSGISYFGVYDGHGNDHVSKYLASNLLGNVHDSFMNQNGSLTERIEKSLKESFMKTNEQYKTFAKKNRSNWGSGGSTGVVAAIYKDENSQVYPMSEDHKPDSPKEKERIEKSGGFVTIPPRGPARLNGILATSRAFGDFDLEPQITAYPDIVDIIIGKMNESGSFELDSNWDSNSAMLILASDGLFDVYGSQEASAFAIRKRKSKMSPSKVSEWFTQSAYDRGSSDNITTLVVFVDKLIELIEGK